MSALLVRGGADALPLILIILSIVIVLVITLTLSAARRRAFEAAAEDVSRRVAGTFHPGGFASNPTIEFQVSGRKAEMEFYPGTHDRKAFSMIRVDLRGKSPGAFAIVPEGLGQSFLKMFGAQDIRIGEPAFDAHWVVKATPEPLAHALFRPDRRRRLCETVGRLGPYRHPRIEITRQSLLVGVNEYLTDFMRILCLFEVAKEFLEFLGDLKEISGIQWIEQASQGSGQCQVCGTGMENAVVKCARCATPHHQECWEYAGECSTFACRERRFVR